MELVGESIGKDLTVREFLDDDGSTVFQLEAPDGTPMGDFLKTYEGREEEFAKWFLQTIKERCDRLNNGSEEQVLHGGKEDREQAQEDEPGPIS